MTFNNGDDRFYSNIFIQPDLLEKKKVHNPEVAAIIGMNPEVNCETGLHIYDDYPLHDEYFVRFSDEATPDTPWGRCYDYDSPLPMNVSGNAYFNGAKPYGKETLNYVDTKHKVTFELVDENGKYTFKTNLYDYLPKLDTEFVDTELLGIAFEPEQPFENPDGSPCVSTRIISARTAGHIPPLVPLSARWN